MAKLFITDYASYNNGLQFVCGEWYDLEDYNDASELFEAVQNHYLEVLNDPINNDEKDLYIKYGIDFENLANLELMYTDFEGFPQEYYSESMNLKELFSILPILKALEEADDNTKIHLHNTACQALGYSDNEIYEFDDDFFNTYFEGRPMEAARATHFGQINWDDNYITFNGYGNLKSISNVNDYIDESNIIEAFKEYPEDFNL